MSRAKYLAPLLVCASVQPAHAIVYYTQPGDGGATAYPGPPTRLFGTNENGTGGFTQLGRIRLGGADIAVSAIAMRPDGELFGFEYRPGLGSRLIHVDRTTIAATLVGAGTDLPVQITGAAFDRDDNLWVLVKETLSISRFDVASLALAGDPIRVPNPGDTNGGDLAFDRAGGCFYVGTNGSNSTTPIYRCDLANGTFTSLGLPVAVGFDNGQISPAGIAVSLDNEHCSEVLMISDGHFLDQAGLVNLGVSPPVVTAVATTLDIAWWNQPDMAAFPSVRSTTLCNNVCGDGDVDPGEECDDGNTASGDGCSSACLREASANHPPVAVCHPAGVLIGPDGTAAIAPADVDGGSYDPDGNLASLSVTPGTLSCADLPGTEVRLTAVDTGGASASCQAAIWVVDITPPVIVAPVGPIVVDCASSGAALPPASASDNCTVASFGNDAPAVFPAGDTTVTWTAIDVSGNTTRASVVVRVGDTTPPAIDSLAASATTLWPPNRRMHDVALSVGASDQCSSAPPSCAISSVEVIDVAHDASDVVITGATTLRLRATRAGEGSGRTYRVTVDCSDTAGNTAARTVDVRVPHDQGR